MKSIPELSSCAYKVQQTVHESRGLGTGIRQNPGIQANECDVSHGISQISIAELVGDTRLKRTTCALCRKSFMARAGTRIRITCEPCTPEWFRIRGRAQHAVHCAVKSGKLARPTTLSCADCGKPAFGYEHRNYAHVLAVDPICRSCNYTRGAAIYAPEIPA